MVSFSLSFKVGPIGQIVLIYYYRYALKPHQP